MKRPTTLTWSQLVWLLQVMTKMTREAIVCKLSAFSHDDCCGCLVFQCDQLTMHATITIDKAKFHASMIRRRFGISYTSGTFIGRSYLGNMILLASTMHDVEAHCMRSASNKEYHLAYEIAVSDRNDANKHWEILNAVAASGRKSS